MEQPEAYYRLQEQPTSTDIHMCEGLFVKHNVFSAGSYIPQHSHASDHLSVIATGEVRVWADGVFMGVYTAPAGIVIKAGVKHLFKAMQNGTTVLCVHRVDEALGGEIVVLEEHQIVGE